MGNVLLEFLRSQKCTYFRSIHLASASRGLKHTLIRERQNANRLENVWKTPTGLRPYRPSLWGDGGRCRGGICCSRRAFWELAFALCDIRVLCLCDHMVMLMLTQTFLLPRRILLRVKLDKAYKVPLNTLKPLFLSILLLRIPYEGFLPQGILFRGCCCDWPFWNTFVVCPQSL